jgi:hypothetical protein
VGVVVRSSGLMRWFRGRPDARHTLAKLAVSLRHSLSLARVLPNNISYSYSFLLLLLLLHVLQRLFH